MTYVSESSFTATGVIFSALAIIASIARAVGWRRSALKLELDDILIIPALFFTLAISAAIITGAQLQIIGGHSLPAITPTQQYQLGKYEYAFWIVHVLAVLSIKLALLFLFRRIFRGRAHTTGFDYVNWTLIVVVVMWAIALLFTCIFVCGANPSASWTSLDSLRTKCINTFAQQAASAVISWALDLAILIEPLVMVGTLKMSSQRKIQASFVFLFSIFAVIAGLLRTIIWIQVVMQGNTQPTTLILGTTQVTADEIGIVSIIIFWTYIEIGVGFLVACLPRCTWILKEAANHPHLSRFRSFHLFPSIPSLWARSRGNSGSRLDEGPHNEEFQRPWTSTTQLKNPATRHFDGGFELKPAALEV